jgi:hypothetical protein
MNDVVYTNGPRIIDGVNIDATVDASHPVIRERGIADPVNDGSLGTPAYVPESKNKDGTPL